MSKGNQLPDLPQGMTVVFEYKEWGSTLVERVKFSPGDWGQVKVLFDTREHNSSATYARFEADNVMRALQKKGWNWYIDGVNVDDFDDEPL